MPTRKTPLIPPTAATEAAMPARADHEDEAEHLLRTIDAYTPTQLAKLLSKEERTLANWRHGHIGPQFIKVGPTILYQRTDVLEWLRNHRKTTTRYVPAKLDKPSEQKNAPSN